MAISAAQETVKNFHQQVIEILGDEGHSLSESDPMARLQPLTVTFKTQILPLTSIMEGKSDASQWLSALTELNRHIRLLAVDISFFRAAQQSDRAQQKLTQIRSRLQQIQGFSQVLLKLSEDCL